MGPHLHFEHYFFPSHSQHIVPKKKNANKKTNNNKQKWKEKMNKTAEKFQIKSKSLEQMTRCTVACHPPFLVLPTRRRSRLMSWKVTWIAACLPRTTNHAVLLLLHVMTKRTACPF